MIFMVITVPKNKITIWLLFGELEVLSTDSDSKDEIFEKGKNFFCNNQKMRRKYVTCINNFLFVYTKQISFHVLYSQNNFGVGMVKMFFSFL